jgi:hypothetical protein
LLQTLLISKTCLTPQRWHPSLPIIGDMSWNPLKNSQMDPMGLGGAYITQTFSYVLIGYFGILHTWIGHFNWTLASFLLSKAIRCPSYIKTSLIANPFASMCTSKSFTKFGNRSTSADNNFPYKRLNTLYCLPFHSNEPFFLKRSMSGLANAKNSFVKLM